MVGSFTGSASGRVSDVITGGSTAIGSDMIVSTAGSMTVSIESDTGVEAGPSRTGSVMVPGDDTFRFVLSMFGSLTISNGGGVSIAASSGASLIIVGSVVNGRGEGASKVGSTEAGVGSVTDSGSGVGAVSTTGSGIAAGVIKVADVGSVVGSITGAGLGCSKVCGGSATAIGLAGIRLLAGVVATSTMG